jgi:hypothetical protein
VFLPLLIFLWHTPQRLWRLGTGSNGSLRLAIPTALAVYQLALQRAVPLASIARAYRQGGGAKDAVLRAVQVQLQALADARTRQKAEAEAAAAAAARAGAEAGKAAGKKAAEEKAEKAGRRVARGERAAARKAAARARVRREEQVPTHETHSTTGIRLNLPTCGRGSAGGSRREAL